MSNRVDITLQERENGLQEIRKGVEQQYTKGSPKKTSIGKGPNSRPLNKHKRANWKKYRGQG